MSIDVTDYLTRLKAEVGRESYHESMAQWIADNTTINDVPWSYYNHEYQIDIANCTANDLSVRKSAQVGMSELAVRAMLAYQAVVKGTTAIYVLPSAAFAMKFSKARVVPVIETSETLSNLLVKGSDAADYKRFSNGSDLYMVGSYGQQQAISIPAKMLVTDEMDFCNQQTLTTFASRLQHAEDGGVRRRFSTPTVDGYGVSKTFMESDQRYYFAQCDYCSHWQHPDLFLHCRIPGWDDDLRRFEKEDLDDPRVDVSATDIYCEKCDKPLNLFGKREWVAKFPSREKVGFHVSPLCVPKYRPPAVVFKDIGEYSTKSDWVNFAVGEPYSDDTTSVSEKALKDNSTLRAVPPHEGADACIAGIDVGKTSWVLIGKRVANQIHVLHAESIKIGEDGTRLLDRLIELFTAYNVYKAVIDSAPFADTVLRLVSHYPHGCVSACYYRRFMTGKNMKGIQVDEQSSMVGVDRTKMFDNLIKKVNTGKIKFGRFPDLKQVHQHLGNLRRIESFDDKEKLVSEWVSTGPDHYAHGLQYLTLAAELLESNMEFDGVGVRPSLGRIQLGSNVSHAPKRKLLTSERHRNKVSRGAVLPGIF